MKGKVWLVGAGPGNAGLMTIRGREVLEQADVVVYDALIGAEILNMIPEDARLIFAGKRSGNHFLKQEEINRILLEEALSGNRVVRLKGGDPFLFGRGGEELELLVHHDVPFEVVPGVTSAISVPAYNGIPVTHRDLSSGVHIITGHMRENRSYDIDFTLLAKSRETLVFLMGIEALSEICDGLIKAGMDPDVPAAILEKGTTALQRRITATVGTLEEESRKKQTATPAIIVIGNVCELADRYGWYEKKILSGIRIVVTRPRELSSRLASMLREEGAEVFEIPAIRIVPVKAAIKEAGIFEKLEHKKVDWIVFTSPSGIRVFFDQLITERDIRILSGIKIAVLGSGTCDELLKHGIKADFVPSSYTGEALGRELAGLVKKPTEIMILRAAIGNKELTDELGKNPLISVTDVATYDTVYERSRIYDLEKMTESGGYDFAVFTSASTVRGFANAAGKTDLRKVKAVCIGKQTANEAENYGMQTRIAGKATLKDLVQCVIDLKENDL